jgi:hypothetical protein
MLDLNRLRDVIARNRANGAQNPDELSRQVHVGKDGTMNLGDSLEAETQPTTKIPQETFACTIKNCPESGIAL